MSYKGRADFNGRRILTNLQEGGKWYELLQYACNNACPNNLDDGLDVHLRSDSVHIYYKGGRILEITTDALHLDSSYFYLRKDIPRTHMEFIRDDNKKELERRSKIYPDCTKEEAKEELESLEKQRNLLFGIKTLDKISRYKAFCDTAKKPKHYFDLAKIVMDKWSESLADRVNHKERMLQQRISLNNRDVTKTDFIVIDIEFSVSGAENCPFRDVTNKYKHPRFDIIAYQPNNKNKLAVIELKYGPAAVGWTDDGEFDDTKSGVKDHRDKFNATIGKRYSAFIKEMQGVLDMKIDLGILPKKLERTIICQEKPDFLLAYAGEKMNEFCDECKKNDLKCIRIEDEERPILKL